MTTTFTTEGSFESTGTRTRRARLPNPVPGTLRRLLYEIYSNGFVPTRYMKIDTHQANDRVDTVRCFHCYPPRRDSIIFHFHR